MHFLEEKDLISSPWENPQEFWENKNKSMKNNFGFLIQSDEKKNHQHTAMTNTVINV